MKHRIFALLPFFVFVVIFAGAGIISKDFYSMPAYVAFLIALFIGFLQNKKLSFNDKLAIVAKGAGDVNIITMVLIFLVAPCFSVIEKRLRGRGDTGEADMEKRLKKARWEYEMAVHYDYIVLNDTKEHAVEAIDSILTAEKLRAERQTDLLKMEESL